MVRPHDAEQSYQLSLISAQYLHNSEDNNLVYCNILLCVFTMYPPYSCWHIFSAGIPEASSELEVKKEFH